MKRALFQAHFSSLKAQQCFTYIQHSTCASSVCGKVYKTLPAECAMQVKFMVLFGVKRRNRDAGCVVIYREAYEADQAWHRFLMRVLVQLELYVVIQKEGSICLG